MKADPSPAYVYVEGSPAGRRSEAPTRAARLQQGDVGRLDRVRSALMDVLGLIPARGGSKGIPRKNLAPVGGKPLLAWTVEAARAATELTRVVVSTDDDEIAAAAGRRGAAQAGGARRRRHADARRRPPRVSPSCRRTSSCCCSRRRRSVAPSTSTRRFGCCSRAAPTRSSASSRCRTGIRPEALMDVVDGRVVARGTRPHAAGEGGSSTRETARPCSRCAANGSATTSTGATAAPT